MNHVNLNGAGINVKAYGLKETLELMNELNASLAKAKQLISEISSLNIEIDLKPANQCEVCPQQDCAEKFA